MGKKNYFCIEHIKATKIKHKSDIHFSSPNWSLCVERSSPLVQTWVEEHNGSYHDDKKSERHYSFKFNTTRQILSKYSELRWVPCGLYFNGLERIWRSRELFMGIMCYWFENKHLCENSQNIFMYVGLSVPLLLDYNFFRKMIIIFFI